MGIPLKIFIIIESFLALLAIYTMLHTGMIFGLIVVSFIFYFLRKRGKQGKFFLWAIVILTLLILVSNVFLWLMVLAGVLYYVFFAKPNYEFRMFNNRQNINYHMVEVSESGEKVKKRSQNFFFDKTEIGKSVFEWDDINIQKLAGTVIVDLGNTLLPHQENTVVVQNFFGKITVLVPFGVGVSLKQSAVLGELNFLDEKEKISNETLTIYSENYEESEKKVKIISTILFGEVEVKRI